MTAFHRFPTLRSAGLIVAAAVALTAFACGDSSTSPSTVSTIAVTGTVPAVGSSAQFTATATMANGSTQDVTSTAAWNTSSSTNATVSSTGLVTAVASGAVTIQATFSGITGADAISIP